MQDAITYRIPALKSFTITHTVIVALKRVQFRFLRPIHTLFFYYNQEKTYSKNLSYLIMDL